MGVVRRINYSQLDVPVDDTRDGSGDTELVTKLPFSERQGL